MGKTKRNIWYKIRNQNLSIFMRDVGFDLAVYDYYPSEVKDEVKRLSINAALKSLRDDFEDQTGDKLKTISHGVYVIRLASGMSVEYSKGHSPVLYIGQGAVESRLKAHYHFKLFDFMRSLGSVNFDFYVCEPWKKYHRDGDYHQQVEYDLISDFATTYGGIEDSGFPLMNKIKGSNKDIEATETWWRKPLKRSGSKINWILRPGPNSEFLGVFE